MCFRRIIFSQRPARTTRGTTLTGKSRRRYVAVTEASRSFAIRLQPRLELQLGADGMKIVPESLDEQI